MPTIEQGGRMKRILVTGGAGFLGSNLCARLLADGHRVFCMDNFYTGREVNIKHLFDNDRFALIRRDVTQGPPLLGVDEIYNLACPASPPAYQSRPISTMKTCVLGALSMLELAKHKGAKILQASTSEVYGEPEQHPQCESYRGNVNPIGIRACYDEGKRASEALFMDYNREYGLDTRIVRIFNTYGPNMRDDDGRVVTNFICQALENRPITIYGAGEQTRSFCFVDDLIEGLVRMMAGNHPGPVNLGNPNEFTIKELAEKVIRLTKSRSEIVYEKLPLDDPTRRCPDITLARKLLNWEPRISLEQGLKKTIEYLDEL